MQRADSLEKTLMLGKIEGRRRRGQQRMVGWHQCLSGHQSEQTPGDIEGQGSLTCHCSQGHKESDTTERLNNNNNNGQVWEGKYLCSLFPWPGQLKGMAYTLPKLFCGTEPKSLSLWLPNITPWHTPLFMSQSPTLLRVSFWEHFLIKLEFLSQKQRIARRNINNLRYADVTTLMAESEEELKSLLRKVKEESEKVGLKLNIQKTKIMASSPANYFMANRWENNGNSDRLYF